MLLDGKKLVITGVITDDSIAWHVARIALEQGADDIWNSPSPLPCRDLVLPMGSS